MTDTNPTASRIWLALRSLAWAALLPGLFAGYVPWRFFGLAQIQLDLRQPLHLLGLVCIGLGAVLLAACIWEFARSGRGTLAPVDGRHRLTWPGLAEAVACERQAGPAP